MQNQYNKLNQNIEQEEQEINLKDYLHVVSRYKWLVITIFIFVFYGCESLYIKTTENL